jgi:hypothetical protein
MVHARAPGSLNFMKATRSALAMLFTIVLILAPQRAKGPPPMQIDFAKIPGRNERTSMSYWAAPFVKVTNDSTYAFPDEAGIGERVLKLTTTLTWYSETGPIKTQKVDSEVYGHVMVREDGQMFIQGVSEPWRLTLPKKPGSPGYTTSTADSRMFVHEFLPEDRRIEVDLYLHGRLAGTLGPFVRHRAEGVQLGADGAVALLIWKDETKTAAQIVLSDAEGKLRARVDCEDTDRTPIPAPNGIGAILKLPVKKYPENNFTWYTPNGRGDTFEIGPNPQFVGWVPDSAKSLFSVGPGYEHSYQMIDWAGGKAMWSIPCPGKQGHPLAITITPKLVIFSVAEMYKPGPWGGNGWMVEGEREEWIRTFHAVRTEDGSLVARWRAQMPSRWNDNGRERFARIGTKLYYVTPQEFVEISEDDIFAHRVGWQP